MKKSRKPFVAAASVLAAVLAMGAVTYAAQTQTRRRIELNVIEGGEHLPEGIAAYEHGDMMMMQLPLDIPQGSRIVLELEEGGRPIILQDPLYVYELEEALSIFAKENLALPEVLQGFEFVNARFNINPLTNPDQEFAANSMALEYSDGETALIISALYLGDDAILLEHPLFVADATNMYINGNPVVITEAIMYETGEPLNMLRVFIAEQNMAYTIFGADVDTLIAVAESL